MQRQFGQPLKRTPRRTLHTKYTFDMMLKHVVFHDEYFSQTTFLLTIEPRYQKAAIAQFNAHVEKGLFVPLKEQGQYRGSGLFYRAKIDGDKITD